MPIKQEKICSPQGVHIAKAKRRLPFAQLFFGAVLASLSIGSVYAQTDAQRIADLERNLNRALSVIDTLSTKMERLEKEKAVAATPKLGDTAKTASKDGQPDVAAVKPADGNLVKTVAEQNGPLIPCNSR